MCLLILSFWQPAEILWGEFRGSPWVPDSFCLVPLLWPPWTGRTAFRPMGRIAWLRDRQMCAFAAGDGRDGPKGSRLNLTHLVEQFKVKILYWEVSSNPLPIFKLGYLGGFFCLFFVFCYWVVEIPYTGPAQITSLFYYKLFYFKVISMSFCNITISHSSTPCDILGEMFKWKL